MDLWLFIVLLSTVPSLHAHSNGAPYYACGDLMVQHGGNSQAKNNGYFILSDAVNDYTPGHEYLGGLAFVVATQLCILIAEVNSDLLKGVPCRVQLSVV